MLKDKGKTNLGKTTFSVQECELQGVLEGFREVFIEPHGLPPKRSKEHAINLVKSQGPVNVRPYHHPYHHKNEIE